MKSLGGNGSIVTKAGIPVEEALRYVLSLPIATLVSGIDSEAVLDQNLKIVRQFKPLDDDERRAIDEAHAINRRRRPLRALQIVQSLRRPRASQAARVRSASDRIAIRPLR